MRHNGQMKWLAHGEHDVPDRSDWLSPPELEHLESIRFTKRRNEYLTRRWSAKQAIAIVLDIDRSPSGLTRIEVLHHASGAPYVHLDGRHAEVDVSMSDRAGWAVCLVGPPGGVAAGTVGVDVEVVEPRTERFVEDFFTAGERDHVRALESVDERHQAANLIWSAKEAALKVRRVGLRADTRTVEVELGTDRRPDGWSAMAVTGPQGPMTGWWRRDGVFLLTVAYAAAGEPPELLPGGADLATAVPVHSWLERPVC